MLKKLLMCVAIMTLSSTMIVQAENVPTSASFQVENIITGDAPHETETFTYILTPTDETNPMPSEAELEIAGSGTASFDEIVYDTPHLYQYELCQVAGTNEDYTYDSTAYNIHVYVTTDDDGVLSNRVLVYEKGSELKAEKLVFENNYKDPDKNTPETGDHSNLVLPIILIVISLAGIIFLVFRRKRKLDDEELDELSEDTTKEPLEHASEEVEEKTEDKEV